MIAPAIPINEKKRLKALKEYNLLDTLPASDLDGITKLVSYICDVPISLITLLKSDRNYIKSGFGIDDKESPREISFCGHAILEDAPIFTIKDARKDIRFDDNPIVTQRNMVFYAGVPLINKAGYALGTLCVYDTKPRELNSKQEEALLVLSEQVLNLFEVRKQNAKLKRLQKKLRGKNTELKKFAGVVSHDMKMPLANMIMTSDILKAKYGDKLDDKGKEYLAYLKNSSFTLSDYISGLLAHYESDNIEARASEIFDIHNVLEDIVDLLNINLDCEINFPEENIDIQCNRAALEQIFLNLIGNSIKYNDKDKIVIDILFKDKDDFYKFTIKDNGIGIPKDKQKEVFKLFSTIGSLDRDGKKGNGIGLSTVRNLVTNLGGKITVKSKVGQGTVISFTVMKKLEKQPS
jgi:hypothetical protein